LLPIGKPHKLRTGTKMIALTDWVANRLINDAKRKGHTPQLLKILRDESEDEWLHRLMPHMDSLMLTYMTETGQLLNVESIPIEAVLIFNRLKALLLQEVPGSSYPPVKS